MCVSFLSTATTDSNPVLVMWIEIYSGSILNPIKHRITKLPCVVDLLKKYLYSQLDYNFGPMF